MVSEVGKGCASFPALGGMGWPQTAQGRGRPTMPDESKIDFRSTESGTWPAWRAGPGGRGGGKVDVRQSPPRPDGGKGRLESRRWVLDGRCGRAAAKPPPRVNPRRPVRLPGSSSCLVRCLRSTDSRMIGTRLACTRFAVDRRPSSPRGSAEWGREPARREEKSSGANGSASPSI